MHLFVQNVKKLSVYLHGFAEKADDENFGAFPSTN